MTARQPVDRLAWAIVQSAGQIFRRDQTQDPQSRIDQGIRRAAVAHGHLHGSQHRRPARKNRRQRPHDVHHARFFEIFLRRGVKRFLLRAEKDEDGNEQQHRIPDQSENTEKDRHDLSHARRDARGAGVFHLRGKQSSQHAAAVHGESGQKVENNENNIDGQKLGQNAPLLAVDGEQVGPLEETTEHNVETRGDDYVDGRTGQRDNEFLHRFFRDALETGHAADGEQRDVMRADAVGSGGQGVTEFVENDADEEKNDEGQPDRHGARPAVRVVGVAEPGEQKQERGVHTHVDAGQAHQMK